MLDHSYICIPRVRSLGTEFLDSWIFKYFFEVSLLEKCTNTELFLVRIFLYSDWIRRYTGKYGPEIIPYLDTFYAVFVKLKKKNFMAPFFMDGFQLPQGYSHFEAVYFLPFSSQKFLVLILSTGLKRLSRPWSHPVVLNTEPMDWESSALTTRPLPKVI